MDKFGHYYQLVAMKILRPPIRNIFKSLDPKPDGVSYKINLGLLELWHGKQFKGNDEEGIYQHLQLFDQICGPFKLHVFHL